MYLQLVEYLQLLKPRINANNYIITRRVVYSEKRLQKTTEAFLWNLYTNFRVIWFRKREPTLLLQYSAG